VGESGVFLNLNAFGKVVKKSQGAIVQRDIYFRSVHGWKSVNDFVICVSIKTRKWSLDYDIKRRN
jgi:hypothetical protein